MLVARGARADALGYARLLRSPLVMPITSLNVAGTDEMYRAAEGQGRHPFTRVYPSRVRVKGVQFGGRVRVRVRVRVSQGCRRFAKGEGKGARETPPTLFPRGPFLERPLERCLEQRWTHLCGPARVPSHGSIRSSSPLHRRIAAVIEYPCPCTASSCSAALGDQNQPRATPRPPAPLPTTASTTKPCRRNYTTRR